MPSIHFDYQRTGEKNYVRHVLTILVDGEEFTRYETPKKTDFSVAVYDFYKRLGVEVKPVFDGVDFPDCKASLDQLRELTGQMSDFRVWKKK